MCYKRERKENKLEIIIVNQKKKKNKKKKKRKITRQTKKFKTTI